MNKSTLGAPVVDFASVFMHFGNHLSFLALLPTLRTYVSCNQESTLQYQNSRIFLDSRIILEISWTKMGIYRDGCEHETHIT